MQYLYLIKCNSLYKIGITDNLSKRIKTLQTGNPHQLTYEFTFGFSKREQAFTTEQRFHRYFHEMKRVGEWYELTEENLSDFKRFLVELGNGIVPTEIALKMKAAFDNDGLIRQRGNMYTKEAK